MRAGEETAAAVMPLPALISVEDLARVLGWTESRAYRAVSDGDFPAVRTGKRRVWIPAALLRDLLGWTDSEFAARLANPVRGER